MLIKIDVNCFLAEIMQARRGSSARCVSSARFFDLLAEISWPSRRDVCSSARRFHLGEEKTHLAEEKSRRRGDSGRDDCYLILVDKM